MQKLTTCGDGGNRTRVQMKLLNKSTCLLCSLVLNIYPREHTKKINIELKFVRSYDKHPQDLNPMNDAYSLYRVSKEQTSLWPFRRKRKQNYRMLKHKEILPMRLCLHLVFFRKFQKIPEYFTCIDKMISPVEADHPQKFIFQRTTSCILLPFLYPSLCL